MRSLTSIPFHEALAEIDRLRHRPDGRERLCALLAEQDPVYAGRSTGEAERLRGYVLASFESLGAPTPVGPILVEELENGLNPYVVAAAAKALRGSNEPSFGMGRLLLAAIDRVRGSDDFVSYDLYSARAAAPVTALMELFRTLAWLGSRAADVAPSLRAMLDQQPSAFSSRVRKEIEAALASVMKNAGAPVHCCSAPAPLACAAKVAADIGIAAIQLQDQDGGSFAFADFFGGRPSVLTFFYTRCMNPNKCSLTVTKLARLQRLIGDRGLFGHFNVGALTYDPEYDLPSRLRRYGAERGMTFDERNRLLRTTGPFTPVRHWLDLGVGFGSSTVNQHRLELAILDEGGNLHATLVRQRWDEADVLAALEGLLSAPEPLVGEAAIDAGAEARQCCDGLVPEKTSGPVRQSDTAASHRISSLGVRE